MVGLTKPVMRNFAEGYRMLVWIGFLRISGLGFLKEPSVTSGVDLDDGFGAEDGGGRSTADTMGA